MNSFVPLVSVCVITYNQEEYIGSTLNDIFAQKTEYLFEVVVGEDCSRDRTRDICLDYQKRFPDKMNLLQNEKNLGLIGNFLNTIDKCQGKYIALCAGDDNWIDPLKLQKQVDFMERNPDYTLCSHEAYYNSVYHTKTFKSFVAIIFNNYILNGWKNALNIIFLFFSNNIEFWKRKRINYKVERPDIVDEKYAIKNILSPMIYPASSNLIRRDVLDTIPREVYFTYRAEHLPIIIWSSLLGKIKLLKEPMIIKNTNAKSVSMTKLHLKKTGREDKTERVIEMLYIFKKNVKQHQVALIANKIEKLKLKV